MKTVLSLTVAAFAVVVSFAPAASAADEKAKKKAPDLSAAFKKADADNDGKLTATEFARLTEEMQKKKPDAKPGKVSKKADALFSQLDADKNGSLSLDELKKFTEVRKEKKKDKQ